MRYDSLTSHNPVLSHILTSSSLCYSRQEIQQMIYGKFMIPNVFGNVMG